uniref:SAP domain-containing protein n=1 Tax=Anolis carolinensis TaxID=28377 RepID=A0A803SMD3_ANOCA
EEGETVRRGGWLAELKQECLARGLEAKGNKQDLINRLQAYFEQHGMFLSILCQDPTLFYSILLWSDLIWNTVS